MMYYELELYGNEEITIRNIKKENLIDILEDYMLIYENKEVINIKNEKLNTFYYTCEQTRNEMVKKILDSGTFFDR